MWQESKKANQREELQGEETADSKSIKMSMINEARTDTSQ
jgi:hypothetical protein